MLGIKLRMCFFHCISSHREVEESENAKLNYKDHSLKAQLDNGDKDGETIKSNSDVISSLLNQWLFFFRHSISLCKKLKSISIDDFVSTKSDERI